MYELESHKIETWRGDSFLSKVRRQRRKWRWLCCQSAIATWTLPPNSSSPSLSRCLPAVLQSLPHQHFSRGQVMFHRVLQPLITALSSSQLASNFFWRWAVTYFSHWISVKKHFLVRNFVNCEKGKVTKQQMKKVKHSVNKGCITYY